jgi:subtilase family serine protease
MGDDFRNAYIPGAPLKGAGQVNALVQFDGYLLSDIQEYEAMTGRTNILLQNILLDGFNGQPTGNGGEVEVSLDIEMLVSMAPALAKILVYEGNPYSGSPNDVLNQIATDDVAHQISCSWTWGYPTGTTEAILQQMALQGQSFYQASGDSDSYPVGSVVETPSDSPYVTSVGGTTLTMTPGGGAKVSETVWNWDAEGDDGVGSSGGISISYAIPSWQTNVNMSACQGSTTYRNFPDVALTADNVLGRLHRLDQRAGNRTQPRPDRFYQPGPLCPGRFPLLWRRFQ